MTPVLALLLGSALGCGGDGLELVPVKGTVLLNDKPLTTGSVTTLPPTGRGAYGAIQPDGSFELTSGREPGAVIGTHKVAVLAMEGEASQGAETPAGPPNKSLVPARYNNPQTSQLTIEVVDGKNAPVLKLVSP
jgi:hypothetical protein